MGAVPSSTNANIRESTGSYSFQHNEMTVMNAIVQSTQDPGKSADITEKLNSMIYIHVGMDTLTIDSAKLNEYVGFDVDSFVVKELLLTISYKATASGTMTTTQWTSKLNQFRETTRTLYMKELGGNPEQTMYRVTSDDPDKFIGGEIIIDQEKKNAGFYYTIAFPGETVDIHVNLTYDNETGEWYGYGFGCDVNSLKIKMHQSFENRTNTITHFNKTYTYNSDENLYYIFATSSILVDQSNTDRRYVNSQRLSDETWSAETNDILTYEGIKYEPNDTVSELLFRETLQILTSEGTIRASSIYEDSGVDEVTTVDSVFFPVECSDGIFEDVKIIKIEYDNDTYPDKLVRTLLLLK